MSSQRIRRNETRYFYEYIAESITRNGIHIGKNRTVERNVSVELTPLTSRRLHIHI